MPSISNPPAVKIQHNLDIVQRHWDAMAAKLRPNLLRNMQQITYLLKTTVATSKLVGQLLNKRTGTLIRALVPNTPAQGAQWISPTILQGTVGAQGAIAPYAKGLEEGTRAHEIVPVRAKALKIPIGGFMRGARATKAFSRRTGLYKDKGGSTGSDMVIFRKKANIPAQPGRWFIKSTIGEKEPLIRQMLSSSTVDFS